MPLELKAYVAFSILATIADLWLTIFARSTRASLYQYTGGTPALLYMFGVVMVFTLAKRGTIGMRTVVVALLIVSAVWKMPTHGARRPAS